MSRYMISFKAVQGVFMVYRGMKGNGAFTTSQEGLQKGSKGVQMIDQNAGIQDDDQDDDLKSIPIRTHPHRGDDMNAQHEWSTTPLIPCDVG